MFDVGVECTRYKYERQFDGRWEMSGVAPSAISPVPPLLCKYEEAPRRLGRLFILIDRPREGAIYSLCGRARDAAGRLDALALGRFAASVLMRPLERPLTLSVQCVYILFLSAGAFCASFCSLLRLLEHNAKSFDRKYVFPGVAVRISLNESLQKIDLFTIF